MWITFIQALLTVAGYAIDFMGNTRKQREWLAKVTKAAQDKGWARSSFVIRLQEKRHLEIDERLDKMDAEENSKT